MNPSDMTINIPVYVAHYDKAIDRRKYLSVALKNCGFTKAQLSTHYCDRTKIYNSDTMKLVNTMPSLSRHKHIISRMRSGYHILSQSQPAYLGNFLNHIEIWKLIASGDDEFALVIEDDAVITDNQLLRKQLANIPADLDIGYLHAGCGYTLENYYGIKPTQDAEWMKTPERQSRTMCSYVLSRTAARRILEMVFPISWAIDHEINYIQNALGLNVYWSTKHAIVEGSAEGAMKYRSLVR